MGERMARSTRDGGSIAGEQEWGRSAAPRFREYAAQVREFADRARDPGIRARLLEIAEQYEAIAAHLDLTPDAEKSIPEEEP
jgi:hypothetical protein